MKVIVSLLLVIGALTIKSENINFNKLVDENIFRVGDFLRKFNWFNRGLDMPGYNDVAEKYTFQRATVVGLDRLQRTGDCKYVKEGKMSSYEFNIGSSFLVIVIPMLRYKDEDMSVILRVRNNSIHLSFDQMRGFQNVSVNDITLKSLGHVDFMSSSPRYDGADVERIVEDFRVMVNNFLRKNEDEWNEMVMRFWTLMNSNYPEGIFNEFNEHLNH